MSATATQEEQKQEHQSVGQMYREKLVDLVKGGVEKNQNAFLLSYSGLSGVQLSEFRKKLRANGARMFITKNSLARKALEDIKQEELAAKIEGQTAVVWSSADSVEVSKLLVDFSKDMENLTVQGGLLDGEYLEKTRVEELSKLPSKETLQSQLLATIQAPVTRLLGALNAKSRDLLSILKQLSEKKGGNENG